MEYSEIGLAPEKFEVLEQLGYVPETCFDLPDDCWIDHDYKLMQDPFAAYLERNNRTDDARGVLADEQVEIDLFKTFSSFFSCGMDLARVPVMSGLRPTPPIKKPRAMPGGHESINIPMAFVGRSCWR